MSMQAINSNFLTSIKAPIALGGCMMVNELAQYAAYLLCKQNFPFKAYICLERVSFFSDETMNRFFIPVGVFRNSIADTVSFVISPLWNRINFSVTNSREIIEKVCEVSKQIEETREYIASKDLEKVVEKLALEKALDLGSAQIKEFRKILEHEKKLTLEKLDRVWESTIPCLNISFDSLREITMVFAEELIFRLLIQKISFKAFGLLFPHSIAEIINHKVIRVIITSSLFAFGHGIRRQYVLPQFIASVGYGMVFEGCGIGVTTAMHAIHNLALNYLDHQANCLQKLF